MKTFICIFCIAAIVVVSFSCNNASTGGTTATNKEDTTIKAVPDTIKIEFTRVRSYTDTLTGLHPLHTQQFIAFNPAPYKQAQKFWKKLYQDCKVGGIGYDIRDFDFVGVGDPKNTGTIVDSESLVSRLQLDTNVFSKDELKLIVQSASPVPCKGASSSDIAISALLNGNFKIGGIDSALAAAINVAIHKKKNVTYNINGWRRKELNTAWLAHALQTGDSLSAKRVYLNAMLQPGGLIVSKAIYVDSFSLDFGMSDSLVLAIKAALAANPSISFGSLNFQLGINSSSTKTVTAICASPVMIYAYLESAKAILPKQ